MSLFQSLDVWRRQDDGALVCYRCFRVVPDGGFCVQSADFYPPNALDSNAFEKQFRELLSGESPSARSTVYPTIEQAIHEFDVDFENPYQ